MVIGFNHCKKNYRKAVAEQQQQEHHAQQQQQPQAPSRVDEVKANAQEGGASPGGSERSVAERERQRLREQERRRRMAVSNFRNISIEKKINYFFICWNFFLNMK